MSMVWLISHLILMGRDYYCSHFIGEKTEALRGQLLAHGCKCQS